MRWRQFVPVRVIRRMDTNQQSKPDEGVLFTMGNLIDGMALVQECLDLLVKKQKDIKADKDKLSALALAQTMADSYKELLKKGADCEATLQDIKSYAQKLAKLSKSCMDDDDYKFDKSIEGCSKIAKVGSIDPYKI